MPACDRSMCRTRQRGFTLLEMLVVLVLIGVMVAVMVISRGTDRSAAYEQEARRLVELMRLAQEEAILNGRELALRFQPQAYEFQQQIEDQWQTLQQPRLFRPRRLDSDVRLSLYQDGQAVALNQAEDIRILILSSGELTPFELYVGSEAEPRLFHIRATDIGQIDFGTSHA